MRDAIELGLSHGRNAMAIWQDLVVKRYVRKLRGNHTPEARVVIQTAPADGEISAHTTVRDDAGLQPEMRTLPGLSLQHPSLGGITMNAPSAVWAESRVC